MAFQQGPPGTQGNRGSKGSGGPMGEKVFFLHKFYTYVHLIHSIWPYHVQIYVFVQGQPGELGNKGATGPQGPRGFLVCVNLIIWSVLIVW